MPRGTRRNAVLAVTLTLIFVLIHGMNSAEPPAPSNAPRANPEQAPPPSILAERTTAFNRAMERQSLEAIAPYFRPARPEDGAPNISGLWRLLARRIARIERPTVIAVRYERELGTWVAQTTTHFRTCTEDVLKIERAQTVFFLWTWQKPAEHLPFEWFISDLLISSAPPTGTGRPQRPCPILASAENITLGSFHFHLFVSRIPRRSAVRSSSFIPAHLPAPEEQALR